MAWAQNIPVPTFLWQNRGVVPLLKVDKGLEKENDGVSLMKPIPGLDDLLARAVKLGVFGTKMRSVINLASPTGIAAIVAQQFEVAAQISAHGLVPIIEPEVSIKSPNKQEAEAILRAEITKTSRQVAGWNARHAEIDDPGCAGFLHTADRAPERRPRRRPVRWLHARTMPAPAWPKTTA